MKISYQWLKNYLDFDFPPAVVADAITRLGVEVESVQNLGVPANPLLVVGEILSREKHPNADKLSVCKVDVGQGTPLQIVCGAPNCDAGNRVPVALMGCKLPYTENGVAKTFEIKPAKLRGVESQGMLCAADEIGLGGDHEELLILSDRPAIGTPLHQVLPNDTVFELAVLPNRPDVLSHIGVARDLAGKWQLPLKHIKAPVIPETKAPGATSFKGITITDTAGCPHYRGYVIRGVKVGPSQEWLARLLKAVGLRPINNIVDVTNFICFGLGQPLHAFDLSKIEGQELRIRRGVEGEKLTTLDGPTRTLNSSVLVIADAVKPLVIAGIMGGKDSGVTASTTDILLEAAQFNPTLIRKTVRQKAVSSDSSYRYERGIDPLMLQEAAERAVAMILELAGGTLEGGAIVAGKSPYAPKTLSISRDFLTEQLGFKLDCEAIEKSLQAFGFKISSCAEAAWDVLVPSYRLDISRPVDLVEEVLRFYGVDRIPAAPLMLPASQASDMGLYTVVRRLSNQLISLGYCECMHYTLRTKAEAERLSASPELLAISNPLSSDMGYLRSSLIPGLVEALELNRSRGNALAPLFEAGHVFRAHQGKLYELQSIAFVKVISPAAESWKKSESSGFFESKAVVESLLRTASIDVGSPQWQSIAQDNLWQAGHSGYWEVGQNPASRSLAMAVAGFINSVALKTAGFSGTVLAGELTFPLDTFDAPAPAKRYVPFSAFPGTRRDVALIVPQAARAGDLLQTLTTLTREVLSAKINLESVNLFDLYEGQGIPEGHKSLAFALTFRSIVGTLTDDEVNGVFHALLAKLKAAGLTIRG